MLAAAAAAAAAADLAPAVQQISTAVALQAGCTRPAAAEVAAAGLGQTGHSLLKQSQWS